MKKIQYKKDDYTYQMLPHTRKQVFGDVIKLHFSSMLWLGFVLLLFSLPFFIIDLLHDVYLAKILEEQVDVKENVSKVLGKIIAVNNIKASLEIILYVIFSIGFSGVQRILRQYAWEKNVYFKVDFGLGIKQNGIQTSTIFFVGGLGVAICTVSYNAAIQIQGWSSMLYYVPLCIFALFIVPLLVLTSICTPVYSNKLIGNLRIALAMYFKYPLKVLCLILCCGVLLAPQFVPVALVRFIGRTVLCFVAPFFCLGVDLVCYGMLDEVVNRKLHPELVGIGTFPYN